jgi:hypothetical protein
MILLVAKKMPFIGPNLSIDSIAYCEQVGENLQQGGNNGEISF